MQGVTIIREPVMVDGDKVTIGDESYGSTEYTVANPTGCGSVKVLLIVKPREENDGAPFYAAVLFVEGREPISFDLTSHAHYMFVHMSKVGVVQAMFRRAGIDF